MEIKTGPKRRAALARAKRLRRTRIALIAHDGKKEELMTFVASQLPLLKRSRLFATESTGQLLKEKFSLRANLMPSGPNGGDLVIGALVARGKLDVVVFLRDPLAAHPHDCDTWGIKMARRWHLLSYKTTSAILEPASS